MAIDYTEKAKACCRSEHESLVERLLACDSNSKSPADRHRCYRIEARRSGRRSRKCTIGA